MERMRNTANRWHRHSKHQIQALLAHATTDTSNLCLYLGASAVMNGLLLLGPGDSPTPGAISLTVGFLLLIAAAELARRQEDAEQPQDTPSRSWRRWWLDFLHDLVPVTNPVVVAKVAMTMIAIGGIAFAFHAPLIAWTGFFGSGLLLLPWGYYLERRQEKREDAQTH